MYLVYIVLYFFSFFVIELTGQVLMEQRWLFEPGCSYFIRNTSDKIPS